jgi:uncharacterized integral membrane protein (TIGR00698 family)
MSIATTPSLIPPQLSKQKKPKMGLWQNAADTIFYDSPKIMSMIVLLCGALLCILISKSPFICQTGISSLVIAIILGSIYGHTLHPKLTSPFTPGLQTISKHLLRFGIIVYGVRIQFGQIIDLGFTTLLIDIGGVALTLCLGSFIGIKLLKLDKHTALLVSAGTAICGAAAVMAMESTLKSTPHKTCIAIGTVVLFGTLSMFGTPIFLHWLGLNDIQSGIVVGASIHEVAQVVVAGNQMSAVAGNMAIIVKMTRVVLLVPVLLIISSIESNKSGQKKQITIPWFAFGFIVMMAINSMGLISQPLGNLLYDIDIVCLTAAMVGIGIDTHFSKIKSAGITPILLAAILSVTLLLGITAVTVLL